MTVLEGLDALLQGPQPHRLRIGVAAPLTGLLAQVGPSTLHAIGLAASEVTVQRGRSERPLDLVVIDAGGPATAVAGTVRDLVHTHAIDALIGLHTSATRQAIERALTGHRIPYVFTPGHEGTTYPRGVLCSGEPTPQLALGLSSIAKLRDIADWAMLGTDYIWPQAMAVDARSALAAVGARVVWDQVVPSGQVDRHMSAFLTGLARTPARGVVLNMPGSDLTAALEELRAAGLDDRLVRFSGCLEENALYSIGGDTTGNLYSTLHSFESMADTQRHELNARYRWDAGEATPAMNSWAEHGYDAVHLLDRLDRRGLLHVDSMGDPSDPRTPVGALTLRPQYRAHVAVASGLAFDVLPRNPTR